MKDIIKDLEKDKSFSDNKYDSIENKNEYNKANENKEINQDKPSLPEMQVVPPKPLPRTCRTGSVCEPVEENPPKPIARPRTNSCVPVVTSVNPSVPIAGGYKVL